MEYTKVDLHDDIAVVTLCKGKVHEISEPAVDQIFDTFRSLEKDETVRGIIFTGEGKFFSFGLDIPGFLSYRKAMFTHFLSRFTDLYRYLFIYPKPILAALNGHTIAGGCMLANTCDYRMMVSGNAKISLNEITFGSTVFAGAAAILKYLIGGRNAEKIVLTGKMYSAEEAQALGLVDRVVGAESLMTEAMKEIKEMAAHDLTAYAHIKGLLRAPVVKLMESREETAIAEFNDIWYSESTWEKIKEIKIKE
jgi:3,2-trans-enoyl-CoA isomerase